MRRTAILLTLVFLIGLTAKASAAPPTAGDFAADCNADGVVEVDGNQRYVRGTGVLTRHCNVNLTPGSRLMLRGVTLSGEGLSAISSPNDTTIRVVNSRLMMTGPLELTTGCCAGGDEVPDDNGRVVVRRSSLVGSSIQLMASFDGANGRVIVRNSSLTATGELGIQVRASDLGGAEGRVRVRGSVIASAGDLLIRTGTEGRTHVRRNLTSVEGEVAISTGDDGRCRTRANIPELTCTEDAPEEPTEPGDEAGPLDEGEEAPGDGEEEE